MPPTTPEDLLPPAAQEVVRGEQVSPALRTPTKITCDFCGCQLTPAGDVLKMGDEAKRLRNLQDRTDEAAALKDAEIARLKARIIDLEAKAPKPGAIDFL